MSTSPSPGKPSTSPSPGTRVVFASASAPTANARSAPVTPPEPSSASCAPASRNRTTRAAAHARYTATRAARAAFSPSAAGAHRSGVHNTRQCAGRRAPRSSAPGWSWSSPRWLRRGRGGVVIALQGRCAMVPSAAKFLGELLEAERHGVDDDASHVVEILELEGELAATAADVQHRSPAQSLRAEGVDEKTAEVAALPLFRTRWLRATPAFSDVTSPPLAPAARASAGCANRQRSPYRHVPARRQWRHTGAADASKTSATDMTPAERGARRSAGAPPKRRRKDQIRPITLVPWRTDIFVVVARSGARQCVDSGLAHPSSSSAPPLHPVLPQDILSQREGDSRGPSTRAGRSSRAVASLRTLPPRRLPKI